MLLDFAKRGATLHVARVYVHRDQSVGSSGYQEQRVQDRAIPRVKGRREVEYRPQDDDGRSSDNVPTSRHWMTTSNSNGRRRRLGLTRFSGRFAVDGAVSLGQLLRHAEWALGGRRDTFAVLLQATPLPSAKPSHH